MDKCTDFKTFFIYSLKLIKNYISYLGRANSVNTIISALITFFISPQDLPEDVELVLKIYCKSILSMVLKKNWKIKIQLKCIGVSVSGRPKLLKLEKMAIFKKYGRKT